MIFALKWKACSRVGPCPKALRSIRKTSGSRYKSRIILTNTRISKAAFRLGEYGAGDVIIWDRGTYRMAEGGGENAALKGLRKGALGLVLRGRKLKGGFSLVRLQRPRQWLLIKKNDKFASTRDVTRNDRSVKSGRRLPDKKLASRRTVGK